MEQRTRVASYAFAPGDDSLLLVRISERDPDAGMWTLPGGGLEFGEDPEDGLHRELEEETGLTGTVEGVLGVYSYHWEPNPRIGAPSTHSVQIVYEVSTSGEPRNEVGGTTDLARWVPLNELEDLPVVPVVEFSLRKAGHQIG